MDRNSDTTGAITMAMRIFTEEYRDKFKISDNRVKIWQQMLRDFDSEAILGAAYHLVSTREDWPPDIATVRKTAAYISRGELSPPLASEAWEHLSLKIQNRPVKLTAMEKKAQQQTATLYELRHSSNSGADRRRFMEAFEGVLKRRDEQWLALPEVNQLIGRRAALLVADTTKNV